MIRLNSWIDAVRDRRVLLPLIVVVVVAIAFAAAFHEHDELVEGFIGVVAVLSIAVALGVVLRAVVASRTRALMFWVVASGLKRGPPGRPRGPTFSLPGFSPGEAPLLR